MQICWNWEEEETVDFCSVFSAAVEMNKILQI